MLGISVPLYTVIGANVSSGERLVGATPPKAVCVAETELSYQRGNFLAGVCSAIGGSEGLGGAPADSQLVEKLRRASR
jgi:class 3 adenylate cyclase